jgi:lipopolysaccharide export system protein LptA
VAEGPPPAAPAGAKSGSPERPALSAGPASPGKAAATGDAKKPPMELSATTVNAYVIRTAEKNELDRVWCQGAVHVHQEPSSPDDRGVDIRGETLQLNHSPDGSVLVVAGNLAQVQMNKICILGPDVTIDQKNNTATVVGIGAMQMITDKSFEGDKLDKPTELWIHWNKDMFFDGMMAQFRGGIQAQQVDSRLKCQEMQVFLDRAVSFKEGEKGGQPAKVRNLVCDKECRIEDSKNPGGQLQRYTRLTSPAVALDNENGIVNASGPGVTHILQLESEGDDPGTGAAKPAVLPADPNRKESRKQLVLTRVSYLWSMFANNRERTAIFRGDVDLIHVPTPNADLVVDPDHPPPGCMHLHCEQLKVFTRRQANGQTTQEMEAQKKVVINAQDFWGRADVVKYDERLDRIILEGSNGGTATLYQVKNKAGNPQTLTGSKIMYWRKTGAVSVSEGRDINLH